MPFILDSLLSYCCFLRKNNSSAVCQYPLGTVETIYHPVWGLITSLFFSIAETQVQNFPIQAALLSHPAQAKLKWGAGGMGSASQGAGAPTEQEHWGGT